MLKEYNALVYPEALDTKVQNLKTKIYNLEKEVKGWNGSCEASQKNINDYQAKIDEKMKSVKEKAAYKEYIPLF